MSIKLSRLSLLAFFLVFLFAVRIHGVPNDDEDEDDSESEFSLTRVKREGGSQSPRYEREDPYGPPRDAYGGGKGRLRASEATAQVYADQGLGGYGPSEGQAGGGYGPSEGPAGGGYAPRPGNYSGVPPSRRYDDQKERPSDREVYVKRGRDKEREYGPPGRRGSPSARYGAAKKNDQYDDGERGPGASRGRAQGRYAGKGRYDDERESDGDAYGPSDGYDEGGDSYKGGRGRGEGYGGGGRGYSDGNVDGTTTSTMSTTSSVPVNTTADPALGKCQKNRKLFSRCAKKLMRCCLSSSCCLTAGVAASANGPAAKAVGLGLTGCQSPAQVALTALAQMLVKVDDGKIDVDEDESPLGQGVLAYCIMITGMNGCGGVDEASTPTPPLPVNAALSRAYLSL